MKKTLLMFTLMAAVTSASAQPRPNNDGTVTFQYRNDSAKKVQVDVQFAGRKDMTRAADGTWTVTLGPVAPDMYPYCFIVDGCLTISVLCLMAVSSMSTTSLRVWVALTTPSSICLPVIWRTSRRSTPCSI